MFLLASTPSTKFIKFCAFKILFFATTSFGTFFFLHLHVHLHWMSSLHAIDASGSIIQIVCIDPLLLASFLIPLC